MRRSIATTLFTVLGLPLALGASCGNDGSSQANARDQATGKACDKYMACGGIGPGKTYATRESCEIDQRAAWEKMWPPAECDGKVDPGQLSLCLAAIDSVECGNLLDLINVYVNKCPKAKVCPSPVDADSGG